MGYKLTAKKQLWSYGHNKKIQPGETFIFESNNLNSSNLQNAIEKAKGERMTSSSASTPSENDWIIEKF
jgi:hypothetical protein